MKLTMNDLRSLIRESLNEITSGKPKDPELLKVNNVLEDNGWRFDGAFGKSMYYTLNNSSNPPFYRIKITLEDDSTVKTIDG